MSDGISSMEDLIAAQKKERKDLVAKTQKMKHSVPKGDKKKKKEVTAEIVQLLADLDLKHEKEIKEFEVKESAADISKDSNIDVLKDSSFDTSKNSFIGTLKDSSIETLNDSSIDISSDYLIVTSKDFSTDSLRDSEALEIKLEDNEDLYSEIANQCNDLKSDKAPRISRAQKRRNKKAMLERERSKAIAEEEFENLNGKRHIEFENIKRKLSERNLSIYEIPSDGNCLYKAVEHQLSSLGLKQTTVHSLREETCNYMILHMSDYINFLTHPESGDMLTEEQYLKYCKDIASTTAWGGHVEIQVLSLVCGYPIEVIQADSPTIIAGDENSHPKLILSYHRYAFGLGEHYNSVIPVK